MSISTVSLTAKNTGVRFMFDLSAALELSSCVKTKSGAAALNELRMRITGTVVKNGMCRL